MSGNKVEASSKGDHAVVGTRWSGFGGGSDGGQRAGADGGGEETDDVETAKDNQLSGEDTSVTITVGKYHNAPIAYARLLELHHPIMINIWEHGHQ